VLATDRGPQIGPQQFVWQLGKQFLGGSKVRDTCREATHLPICEGQADQHSDPQLDVAGLAPVTQQPQCSAQQLGGITVAPRVRGFFARPLQLGRTLATLR
jgi:hypothetical protein